LRCPIKPPRTQDPAVTNEHVNVIGYISGNLGLGVLARNMIAALLRRGVRVSALDVDPGNDRKNHDQQFDSLVVRAWPELPEGLTLWMFPPPTLGKLAWLYSELYLRPGNTNVAVTMWELPVLTPGMAASLELFDIILAQTDFIRHVVECNASGVRTITDKHFFQLPPDVRPDRQRFGLPADAVIFGYGFDPQSDIRRKNPLAVVRAFIDAVGDRKDAFLAIKLNARNLASFDNPEQRQLLREASSHPRIKLFDEVLTYQEVLSFYASCDVYVSLHRAEGLGLGMMEAMALGKPVIATAWSGNMSFMTDTDSCLIGYS
jgi:glycosyltransferase involved in cell wall biosynthesis